MLLMPIVFSDLTWGKPMKLTEQQYTTGRPLKSDMASKDLDFPLVIPCIRGSLYFISSWSTCMGLNQDVKSQYLLPQKYFFFHGKLYPMQKLISIWFEPDEEYPDTKPIAL